MKKKKKRYHGTTLIIIIGVVMFWGQRVEVHYATPNSPNICLKNYGHCIMPKILILWLIHLAEFLQIQPRNREQIDTFKLASTINAIWGMRDYLAVTDLGGSEDFVNGPSDRKDIGSGLGDKFESEAFGNARPESKQNWALSGNDRLQDLRDFKIDVHGSIEELTRTMEKGFREIEVDMHSKFVELETRLQAYEVTSPLVTRRSISR
ncbi:hypothetical protein L873DRAFT_1002523 [Choiromyces venosus 120613-1]|uniref:Uncharacterized protein n=1 Tax=Choiromyces venosus 120613-1 TaxID=1336337 RepID=A0A3N4JNZ9_9PEZI|nr:hypothetical protein L873DRAFT_1002523 [Choiromyces venosus 120613-1]